MDERYERDHTDGEPWRSLDRIRSLYERLIHSRRCPQCDRHDGEYHNVREARNAVLRSPIVVQTRAGWVALAQPCGEPEEFRILLSRPGHTEVQIAGSLSRGEPQHAALEVRAADDCGWDWEEIELGWNDTDLIYNYAVEFFVARSQKRW